MGMKRLVFLAFATITVVFASPALAQTERTVNEGCPSPGVQATAQYDQYQDPGCGGPSTQSIEEGIKDAIEDVEGGGDAVEGAEAYIGELSPEEAQAEEAPSAEETEETASDRYQHLPDTGGPTMLASIAGAFLLAGGLALRRR